MKIYEDKEETIIIRTECIIHICDMCGRKADHPAQDGMGFEWHTVGISSGMVKSEYSINGQHGEDSVDLCYGCADWIIEAIRDKSLIRPK